MSGVSKRPHEEGVGGGSGGVGHSSSSSSGSKYPHEDVGSYQKLTPPGVPNEYHHPPYDMGSDSRVPKIPRSDSRDYPDRRSPLHSMYRVPHSVAGEYHVDPHTAVTAVAPESRTDSSRESKENVRDLRVENRDLRTEAKEMHGEAKRDSQSAKADKDVRVESETKEARHERDGHIEPRNNVKMDKDVSGPSSGQLNWKDSKEYPRGKRYESPGSVEPWHVSRGTSQGSVEIGKEGPAVEDRDLGEAHEGIGSKADPKGDDRFKEKDRKRKDLKHREWGDRDKEKVDRRSSMQVGGNNSEVIKDSVKEERDADRWERERKDASKDRERLKDEEKDHMKRDPWNVVEKEGLHNDKEPGDGSTRMAEQDSSALELKKQKDLESWKGVDREARDRKKERDVDTDLERNEKRSRLYEKEPDDGCADGEGAGERDKEGFNHGVQQRKRMLRPRGSPMANRDPRFRPRSQENDGSQGKSEVSYVIYKVGECMKDLIKLWKDFEASQSEKSIESTSDGPTLEVCIPAEHVTATNRQVRGGQLWGTDIYTDDSDLVAVLMHSGYCRPTASPPPPGIQELRAIIRVLPPQDSYTSMLRNNVRSRAWGAGIGCSYRVERCCIVKKGGGTIELEPCLTHSSAIEPTLAPVAVERTMTTRAAASNALRQQRFVREVTIQYNLCNEPWIKYSISVVADKGLKKSLYTSARLKKGEVLYLETHSSRYELCFSGEKMVKSTESAQVHEDTEKSNNHHPHTSNGDKNDSGNVLIDVFRWSRCKKPLTQIVMRSVGIPLPLEYVEVIEENLDWEDVQWSQTGVWIAGKEYTLARAHFLSPN